MVSVIIPSYNGEKTVRDCLNSVLAQDFKDYEIIVIDCSEDNTPVIIEREFPGLKLLSLKKKITWGRARNIGIKESKGDYLFFLCIDCIIENDSVSRAVKILERCPELAGLSFSIKDHCGSSPIETVDFLLEYCHWLPSQKRRDFARYMAGTSAIYRRGCFAENIYEDQDIYGEDVILNLRLASKGYRLLFEPTIKATHINHKKTFYSFLKHQMGIGSGAAVIRRKTDPGFEGMFLVFPLLIFSTPFLIVPKIGLTYLLRNDFQNLLFFLRHIHLFFIGNFFWAKGFFKGAVAK